MERLDWVPQGSEGFRAAEGSRDVPPVWAYVLGGVDLSAPRKLPGALLSGQGLSGEKTAFSWKFPMIPDRYVPRTKTLKAQEVNPIPAQALEESQVPRDPS